MWWFIAGMIVGVIATVIGVDRLRVGILHVECSDPYDGPYMFLEVSKDISRRKIVMLEVRKENLMSRN